MKHDHHAYAQYPGFCPDCVQERDERANAIQRDHDAEIDNLVCEFVRTAGDAETLIASLRRTVGRLVHPSVYDIELAEGTAGTDALYELETAARAVRNLQRIAAARHRLLLEKEGVPAFD